MTRLRAEVGKRIADRRVLELIDAFLRQGVLDGGVIWTPEEGTPQGAVISPLLANVYLHPLDVEVRKAGYEIVRHADDFVILCRSRDEAERALDLVRASWKPRGLVLHPEKTGVVDAIEEGFDFLGYHFQAHKGKITRWPRVSAEKALKDTIRERTKRTNGQCMAVIVKGLDRMPRGWFEYSRHGRPWVFERMNKFIRRRLRRS